MGTKVGTTDVIPVMTEPGTTPVPPTTWPVTKPVTAATAILEPPIEPPAAPTLEVVPAKMLEAFVELRKSRSSVPSLSTVPPRCDWRPRRTSEPSPALVSEPRPLSSAEASTVIVRPASTWMVGALVRLMFRRPVAVASTLARVRSVEALRLRRMPPERLRLRTELALVKPGVPATTPTKSSPAFRL